MRTRKRVAMGGAVGVLLSTFPVGARAESQLAASSSSSVVAPDVAATPATPVATARARSTPQGDFAHLVSRRAGALAVDGHLDDPAWTGARRSSGFRQRFPKDGARPSQETEFAVLYDDDALYVGVWAHDSEPALVKGLLTRRDEESPSDAVLVAIDSYHDRRTAFAFGLNPAGVQRDLIIFDDSASDTSWDAVWSGAAAVGRDGWSAEFRIPLSQLRFSSASSQEWGLQVVRQVGRSGEESSWTPWPRSRPEIVSRFGVMSGLERVPQGRRLELLPYVTAGVAARPVDSGDPLHDPLAPEGNFGLDAKYGVSSAFSLAATINPDFGQVEADPSQVNLGTAQLFFPEKRPFFLDGVELFKMGIGQGDEASETLFYSRRIGAAPHGSPDGEFVAAPSATTIYGAAKLSGKLPSGWSVGVLDAVTAEEHADVVDGDGARREQLVEPLTNFGVAKLKRDLRQGKTTIAASATAVHRALGDSQLVDELHDQAYTAGLELSHRFWRDRLALSSKLFGSYVHGSAAAIEDTQRLPRHLYQRPDAGHLSLDPARTSLGGGALVADLSYNDGHWRMAGGVDVRTPGLEVNDLGFQDGTDQAVQWLYGAYVDQEPGKELLAYRVNTNFYSVSNLEPRLLSFGGNVNAHATLVNHWGIGGGVELNDDRWDTRALRGGPALRADFAYALWGYVDSDPRQRVSLSTFAQVRSVPASRGYRAKIGSSARLLAASNLQLALEPSFEIIEDDAQYIDAVEDADGGERYLVGRIRQTNASLTLRAAWTLSPRLSLQAYAQPFLASGDYETYKEVVEAGAGDVSARYHVLAERELTRMDDTYAVDRDGDGNADYGFDRPDFGFGELRSTLVLRWEYRPGSSLFAIWSHGQSGSDTDGEFRLGRGLSRLADSEAEDVVMLKVNYWLGV